MGFTISYLWVTKVPGFSQRGFHHVSSRPGGRAAHFWAPWRWGLWHSLGFHGIRSSTSNMGWTIWLFHITTENTTKQIGTSSWISMNYHKLSNCVWVKWMHQDTNDKLNFAVLWVLNCDSSLFCKTHLVKRKGWSHWYHFPSMFHHWTNMCFKRNCCCFLFLELCVVHCSIIHVYVYIYIYIRKDTHKHNITHIYDIVYVYIYIYNIHTYIHICTYIYIYVYKYT